jgi:hypothetical protein
MGKPRSNRYLSATEIASVASCEQKIVLDARHGELVSSEQKVARDRGNRLHQHFDQVATASHNRAPQPVSGPCFVATQVYGSVDARTDELRRFRDQTLAPSPIGRRLIWLYYTTSPSIADWLGNRPGWARMTRWCLDAVRYMLRHGGSRACGTTPKASASS